MRLCLFPTVEAAGQARRELQPFSELIDPPSFVDLKAVVTELVAISVAHGAEKPIDLWLDLDDGKIEGVVNDHGPGSRALSRAKDRTDDSFVLRIVDALVDEWRASEETGIWFRMLVRPHGSD